jgi:hypothetical protein
VAGSDRFLRVREDLVQNGHCRTGAAWAASL